MKQFKNGIVQFTEFEFDNKIPLHLLYFGNVVVRTVIGEKRRHILSLWIRNPTFESSMSPYLKTHSFIFLYNVD